MLRVYLETFCFYVKTVRYFVSDFVPLILRKLATLNYNMMSIQRLGCMSQLGRLILQRQFASQVTTAVVMLWLEII